MPPSSPSWSVMVPVYKPNKWLLGALIGICGLLAIGLGWSMCGGGESAVNLQEEAVVDPVPEQPPLPEPVPDPVPDPVSVPPEQPDPVQPDPVPVMTLPTATALKSVPAVQSTMTAVPKSVPTSVRPKSTATQTKPKPASSADDGSMSGPIHIPD